MRCLDIANHTLSFWSCKGFSRRAWGLSDDHNCVFCLNITREVEPGLIYKEGDIRNINSFQLNKICKPFTVTYSFLWSASFNSCSAVTLYGKSFNFSWTALCAVASPISSSCTNLCNDFDGLRSIESEMSIYFSPLSLDGLPPRSGSNTEPVSWNFSVSLWAALQWGTGVSGNFSANCFCTKSVYLLPSRKTYSTRKTRSAIERIIVSKNWVKQTL